MRTLFIIVTLLFCSTAFAGGSCYTDDFGNTTFSDGTSAYTDDFGNTTCN